MWVPSSKTQVSESKDILKIVSWYIFGNILTLTKGKIYHHEPSIFINVHNTYVCENILTFIKINMPSLMLNFLQCLFYSLLELSFCYPEVSISSFSPMYYCNLAFPSIITKIPLYLMWYHTSCRIFRRRHKVTITYKVLYGL